MTRRILPTFCVLFLACGLAALPDDARGCAPAPRAGEHVDVADESALIIWDESSRTEHFIRQATFVGSAYDFGFLVPTPNRPQLELADPELFAELARITAPRTEHRTETGVNLGCSKRGAGTDQTKDIALPGGVVVLEQKRVGNLDASVLTFRADKGQKLDEAADELLAWLNRNGYAVRPDLADWVKEYIAESWIITAFKIAGQAPPDAPSAPKGSAKSPDVPKGLAVKSATVRMSFKTDRPFFPYREPAAQRDEQSKATPRLLRLYVAARQRMTGAIGEKATDWPGQTVWANAITDAERDAFLSKAKLTREAAPGKWWLTEFEDRSSPRPGTDELYFSASTVSGTVARTPNIVISYKTPWWVGPTAIIALIVLIGGGMYFRRRKPADTPEPEKK